MLAAYIAVIAIALGFWGALFVLLPWQVALIAAALFALVLFGMVMVELRPIEVAEPPSEEMRRPDLWDGIDNARARNPERREAA